MMCHTIGLSPMGNIGLGSNSLTSRIRLPCPPHRMTAFMLRLRSSAPPGPMCKYARPAASVNNNQKQAETRDRKPGTFFLQFAIFDHVLVWGPGLQGAYVGGHANWFAAAAGGVLISLAVMAEVTKPVSVQA